MFDKTRKDIHRQTQKFQDTNHHYSDLGKKNAREILRSRQDEHKDEYMKPADSYDKYFKDRRDAFNRTALWKKIGILIILAIIVFLIILGWLG